MTAVNASVPVTALTTVAAGRPQPTVRQVVKLDGQWGFVPRDVPFSEVATVEREAIVVPGLWETQGWLRLDGAAWYLREFGLDDLAGHWTLRFAAVMDEAEVYLNGALVGRHAGAYTPFGLDVTAVLRQGRNLLAVRVLDVVTGTPEHLRSPHGKQGWKNDLFPSPPSLYMSYGGIWQSVTLMRHSAVTLHDPFVNGDPDDPRVQVTVRNRGPHGRVVVECVVAGEPVRAEVALEAAAAAQVVLRPRLAGLPRWSPEAPTLHTAVFRVLAGDEVLDEQTVRFGVRTVAVDGDRIVLNGNPVRVQGALVQGYRGDTLYAEGTRADIEQEVLAAKAAGLNVLRLHIKAFDPAYLDVCDEVGMLVHCDLPIAEPLAVDELDDTGPLAELCASAATEQVLRDRNHPSVVLWSVMNEIGAEDQSRDTRATPGYERFVRLLYGLVTDLDGTRPIIENDYIEPGPEHVYLSPVLTAHWYGRLSQDYLTEVLRRSEHSAVPGKVLLVSEFGDWALPGLPDGFGPAGEDDQPFWWPTALRDEIADLPWPRGVDAFVRGTQAYKGIADRLQIEIFRRNPAIAGWCLTELTDVPHEYNGLWEIDRTPKPEALRQVSAACRTTLPMLLHRPTGPVRAGGTGAPSTGGAGAWNGWADEPMHLSVVVSHDSAGSPAGEVSVRFEPAEDPAGGTDAGTLQTVLVPYGPTAPVALGVRLPAEPGPHDLVVRWAPQVAPAEDNRYRVHVFARPVAEYAVSVLGSAADAAALAAAGAAAGENGLLVVGEGALSAQTGPAVEQALRAGRDVLVLAQDATAAPHLPVPAVMVDVATEWGSLPYVFSTDESVLGAVPAGTVVTTELLSITARVVYRTLDGARWPQRLVLGMYKPAPNGLTGTVVGALPVHHGRLWLCQLPIVAAALRDDPTAVATLADLLGAAAAAGGLR